MNSPALEEAADAGLPSLANFTIIVACDRETGMSMSRVVPRDGATDTYAARRIVRSDQEPAVQVLVEQVRAMSLHANALQELSPLGSSSSNEQRRSRNNNNKVVEGVARTSRMMKLALEPRLGVGIDQRHPVIPCIVEHASVVLNRCERGHDGK